MPTGFFAPVFRIWRTWCISTCSELLQMQHGIPNFERDRKLMLHWSRSTVA